jgi:hypothetical protein
MLIRKSIIKAEIVLRGLVYNTSVSDYDIKLLLFILHQFE